MGFISATSACSLNLKRFTGNTLTEQGRFTQYTVDSLTVHNSTDTVLNDDEVNPGKSHYPKLISCIVSPLITEETQMNAPITLYGSTVVRTTLCLYSKPQSF